MELKKKKWWWHFGFNDEWTPKLVTKFSWEVKTWSRQEFEYVYWFMNELCKTILSEVIRNWLFTWCITLKSPNNIVKKDVLKVIARNEDYKLVLKLRNVLCDWLGDCYRANSTHLFLMFNSIVTHFWRNACQLVSAEDNFCSKYNLNLSWGLIGDHF